MVLYVIAAVCVAYFIGVALYTGLASKFHLIWLVIAALFVLVGRLFDLHRHQVITVPKPVMIGFCTLFVIAVVGLGTVEGAIIYHGNCVPANGAKYVMVLGTQIRGTQITVPLKYRLDAAVDYYAQNPETQIIVTGGQGSGEDIPEAAAMQSYLLQRGIPKDKILVEDRSTNTDENVRFSRELMDSDEDSVVVVTNAFHVYRSLSICKKQGLTHVQGLGAKNNLIMIPSYYLREGIAVIKYKICDQI